ncbi:hypothetical protein KBA01_07370 [Kozakia baliensis]|nr:hypothetical protein KBA01_07370 [Kozakia baliensis]
MCIVALKRGWNGWITLMNKQTIRLTGLALLSALALSACGKKGEPHAPGPSSAITYPRTYPPE